MIGKKVSSICLDNAELDFYKWDGELADILGRVRSQAQPDHAFCQQYNPCLPC